jgi:hypothetical protein
MVKILYEIMFKKLGHSKLRFVSHFGFNWQRQHTI